MNVAVAATKRIAIAFAETVYDNPVVTREFRTRMRGKRAFIVMGAYVLLLSLVLFLTYYDQYSSYGNRGMQLVNRNVGMTLFQAMTWVQVILLTFIIPALTSGAISQELEKKTIEMLALSKLTAGKIAVGKQLSGFLYSLVLLVCSIPLASMCLMFGGISPAEIAVAYLMLIAWSFLFTSAGVFWSSLFSRTATAALLCYASSTVYFLITLIMGVATFGSRMMGSSDVYVFSALNPIGGAYLSLQSAEVAGIHVPVAAAAIGLNLSMGILMLLIASTHVRHHKVERALPIRIMMILITAAITWLNAGNRYGIYGMMAGTSKIGTQWLATGAICTVVMLLMAIPIMATGQVCDSRGGYGLRRVFDPKRMFKSDMRGAICFMLLWTIVLFGVMGLVAMKSLAGTGSLDYAFWAAYAGMSIASLAMMIGMGAVGVFMSSVVASRRSAAGLTLLFVILSFIIYPIMLIWYIDGVSDVSNPIWQIAAWWPPMPYVALANEWKGFPKVWWPSDMAWLVSSAAYIALAVIAFYGASAAAKKLGGVREE